MRFMAARRSTMPTSGQLKEALQLDRGERRAHARRTAVYPGPAPGGMCRGSSVKRPANPSGIRQARRYRTERSVSVLTCDTYRVVHRGKRRFQEWLERWDRSNQATLDASRPPPPETPAVVLQALTSIPDPAFAFRLRVVIDGKPVDGVTWGWSVHPLPLGGHIRTLPSVGVLPEGVEGDGARHSRRGQARDARRLLRNCFGHPRRTGERCALRLRGWGDVSRPRWRPLDVTLCGMVPRRS